MKLIAIDLDGTLLNDRSEVNEENIEAIKHAQKLGIEVVIATGRAYYDALPICKKAGISTYIISYNGASINSKKGKEISSITMDKKDVEETIKYLEKYNFYYEVVTNKGIYTRFSNKELLQVEMDRIKSINPKLNIITLEQMAKKQFNQFKFVSVKSYKEILEKDEEFFSILALSFDELKLKAGIKHFENMKHLSLFSSADHNFELVNSPASKGYALEKLSNTLDISLDEAMAIGDSYNDVPMLKKVNYSVAMGNAKNDIKALCKFVTLSNEDNGVAYAIHKFIDTPAVENSNLSDISLA